MFKIYKFGGMKKVLAVLALLLVWYIPFESHAKTAPKASTYKDDKGWKLQVDGEDFYVKGVVWDYKPVGANYSYDLYGQSDKFIKDLIDHEFSLMAKAGITATRSFVRLPPKWVSYIYETYGIMTVVNPLMGRYGNTVSGFYTEFTDYSDPATREGLKAEVLEFVKMYKGVPGVLMIALGNESNYGLSWSSFEIENLPVGEQNREKARFLYSLFNEVIQESRKIDPERLYTIVNGDIQYIDLIAEYGKDWDLLGINAYRGISFDNPSDNNYMWATVKEKLDIPIVFMEFGADAFNARDFAEDQPAQATYLKGQWQEIYSKSYGNGEEGNALGGFVFEWRDEWWKHKQTENLNTQDRTASWENGGYKLDHIPGQNNMNEEWFGIARMGEQNNEGVYVAEPRMAYDVLAEIWRMNPYSAGKSVIESKFSDINMEFYALKSEILSIKKARKEEEKVRLVGGSFIGEYAVRGFDSNIDENGENGLAFTDGQRVNLDIAFQPTKNLKGDFSVNILANVLDSDFEFRYGDRAKAVEVVTVDKNDITADVVSTQSLEGIERIEIYDFQATYEAQKYDLSAFYHVPRYHWGHEGDFFGLMREATDMPGQDVWNSKAPYGVEFEGKGNLGGLKIVAGPEVYWGANPKAIVKYEFGEDDNYAFIFSEDIARRGDSAASSDATEKQSRQITLYGKRALRGGMELEVGALMSSNEKIGDRYDRYNGNVIVDEIKFEDTLGVKAKLAFDVGNQRAYVAMNYAGLVADAGDPLREFNTALPYSSLGNKQEVEAGIRFYDNPYMLYPRILYRENIVKANPTIAASTTAGVLSPGVTPRNREDDPFAVLDNRAVRAAELYFTYDPSPGSWFYDWDIDFKETSALAYNVGLTYSNYINATDSNLFFEDGNNFAFGEGIAKDELWLLKSKVILNTSANMKTILNFYAGRQQTSGKPNEKAEDFFSVDGKLIFDKTDIYSGYIKVDDFGPYGFYRQFNLVYPLQLKLEYAALDRFGDEQFSSKIGVKGFYRTLDARSPANEYQDGKNDYMTEIQTYFEIKF